MTKSVDVDELKEWVENWFLMNRSYHPYSNSNNIPISELYDILERVPTVEPKHGHNTNDGVRWFRCSECGWGMNDIYMADESMVEDFDKFPYYCPYCGAKIEEVEDAKG